MKTRKKERTKERVRARMKTRKRDSSFDFATATTATATATTTTSTAWMLILTMVVVVVTTKRSKFWVAFVVVVVDSFVFLSRTSVRIQSSILQNYIKYILMANFVTMEMYFSNYDKLWQTKLHKRTCFDKKPMKMWLLPRIKIYFICKSHFCNRRANLVSQYEFTTNFEIRC